jgi:hypothetical protein
MLVLRAEAGLLLLFELFYFFFLFVCSKSLAKVERKYIPQNGRPISYMYIMAYKDGNLSFENGSFMEVK